MNWLLFLISALILFGAIPALGGFLVYKGFVLFKLIEPKQTPVTPAEPAAEEKSTNAGFKPPAEVTLGLCMKVFFCAVASAYFVAVIAYRFLPLHLDQQPFAVQAAIYIIVETSFAVAFMRRFTVPAIGVILGAVVVTWLLVFAGAMVVQSNTQTTPPARTALAGSSILRV